MIRMFLLNYIQILPKIKKKFSYKTIILNIQSVQIKKKFSLYHGTNAKINDFENPTSFLKKILF